MAYISRLGAVFLVHIRDENCHAPLVKKRHQEVFIAIVSLLAPSITWSLKDLAGQGWLYRQSGTPLVPALTEFFPVGQKSERERETTLENTSKIHHLSYAFPACTSCHVPRTSGSDPASAGFKYHCNSKWEILLTY